jgi:hypothetical protein
MNEKKALNFDFLDKGTKNADEKPVAPLVTENSTKSEPVRKTESNKTHFLEYFKEYYQDFSKFCEKHLTKANPKYFLLVGWVVGMGLASDRISDSTSWGEVWGIVIGGGIIAGAVAYWIQGWFYNVRIGWSKGKIDADTGKYIWLYSMLPIGIVNILALFFNNIAYGSDYFSYYSGDVTAVDGIFAILACAAIAYSIAISYKAVRKIAHVEKGRAIWWFIVAPAIFYLLVIITASLV